MSGSTGETSGASAPQHPVRGEDWRAATALTLFGIVMVSAAIALGG